MKTLCLHPIEQVADEGDSPAKVVHIEAANCTEQPAGWIPGPASRDRSRGDQSHSSASRFIPSGSDEFAGQTVYHETFGKGSILSSSGVGSNKIFQVRFANAGVKKILGRYLLLDD